MTHDSARPGATPLFDLARLLAPLDERTFFAEYWQQQPLVLTRGRADYYGGLCSMADVDHILTAGDLRYPALRLIRNGPDLPIGAFTHDVRSRRFTFTGVCDPERVLEEYRAGATILLQRLDRTWPALGALCRALEERLFHAADANAYLTPKAAQGFGAHYDTHDVFVLQIAGSKHWRLHGTPLRLPLESQPFDGRVTPAGPCVQEVDVQPGDLIYLPRGTVHSALTADTSSLHVTIGVTPQTWADALVAAVLTRAQGDERLREAVPLALDRMADEPDAGAGSGRPRAAVQQRFAELLASVAENVDVSSVLDMMQARFVAERRPRIEGRLLEIETHPGGLPAGVARRPGLIYQLAVAGDRAVLSFHSRTLAYPAHFEPALRAVADGDQVDVPSIPGLDALERTLFVQRLLTEGFLVARP